MPGENIGNENNDAGNDQEAKIQALLDKVDKSQAAIDSMQQNYKKIEKERNQLLSGYKNLGSELEKKGLGSMKVEDDTLKVEFNKTVTQQNKSELDILEEQKQSLSRKYDNADIDEKEYYSKLAEIEGEKSAIKRIDQDRKRREKEKEIKQQKMSHDEWVNKTSKDFSEAFDTNSELFKKMNELAISNVDYQKDASRFYELARSASISIGSNSKGSDNDMNNDSDFSSLKNSGATGANYNQKQIQADVITNDEKISLEQRFGKDTSAKLSKILNDNKKIGNLIEGDQYYSNSRISLPIY